MMRERTCSAAGEDHVCGLLSRTEGIEDIQADLSQPVRQVHTQPQANERSNRCMNRDRACGLLQYIAVGFVKIMLKVLFGELGKVLMLR